MNILGVSCFYHDAAACLVQDGQIIAAAQEERFTRIKHDPRWPIHAILYCLTEGQITTRQLDCIAFYDNPKLTFERVLRTGRLKHILPWLHGKLNIKNIIRQEPDYTGKVFICNHHDSHAASAFYPSPFERAAILTVDGVGEWATASFGTGQGNTIRMTREMRFPNSVGLLYSTFTGFTGFRVNSGEYKMMGLAPYGKPTYKDLILGELVDSKPDGTIELNMRYFDFYGDRMFNEKFELLFGGPARVPESPITQREMDLAASIQAVTEETILKMACRVRAETGQANLCLAGGVALNCVANGRLLRDGPFKDIWIQPAAGDAGGALGAALLYWHGCLGHGREVKSFNPYLGPWFSHSYIKTFLRSSGYNFQELSDRARTVATLIAEGKVVGYFSGRMEFGPRALGNRSILADPRRSDMQSILNLKIKRRESFRPFAPVVIQERTSDYFELNRPSPHMLLTAKTRVNSLPAITHVDGSARVQTVSPNDNLGLYAILVEFERLTGCPVLVNTSFNVRGEPIVCSPQDALRCFTGTGIDVLVLEDFIMSKD